MKLQINLKEGAIYKYMEFDRKKSYVSLFLILALLIIVNSIINISVGDLVFTLSHVVLAVLCLYMYRYLSKNPYLVLSNEKLIINQSPIIIKEISLSDVKIEQETTRHIVLGYYHRGSSRKTKILFSMMNREDVPLFIESLKKRINT